MYKVFTKNLANRINPFLDHIISPTQATFLPSRRAADNTIIVQEVLHHLHFSKSRKSHFILKWDMQEAFDRLEWSFIRAAINFFHFPVHFINLIMTCLSSSSLSILINGHPTSFFYPSKGIRQRDSICPYIFIICMKYLSLLIYEVVRNNRWSPIKISKNGSPISHFFFADDVILFAKTAKPLLLCLQFFLFSQTSLVKGLANPNQKSFVPRILMLI